ncbi:MAG: hypothetical protein MUC42_06275 [Bryobacter sp.]|jgi:hypothetical protein|nr:hypothetical protein [Bryobacter sp.]
MRTWFAIGIAVSLAVISFAAFAGEPPKRQQSLWEFLRAYHAVVQTDDERVVQESPKVKPSEPPRWGWHKPKPCHCGHCCAPQTDPGGAINFPPYDVEP